MTNHPIKFRLLIAFALSILFGAVGARIYLRTQQNAPTISFTGIAQLDTASHQELQLNNAIFIENAGAPDGRVYLKFNDGRTLNDSIGKQVQVSGQLRSVKLESGNFISELLVEKVQQIK